MFLIQSFAVILVVMGLLYLLRAALIHGILLLMAAWYYLTRCWRNKENRWNFF